MQYPHFHFTKKAIEQLPISEKITVYHDTKVRGLKLKIQPSGSKSFMLYRKIEGKPERIMLGKFPDLTIENARGIIASYNAQIAQGINPANKQRAIRAEMTFGELFELYLDKHAKPLKETWEQDVRCYNYHLKSLEKRKLSTIKKIDIQRFHTKLGKENGKKYAANRLLALLHGLFNKAIEWGWEHPNPAHGIKKFKEQSRERFLQSDELPKFFEALNQEENETFRDYILISLFIGARKSNVLSMRWENVYLERKTCFIPKTKHGDAHTVPLVPDTIKILTRRKENSDSPWVFPGTGKKGYYSDPKKGWVRLLERANIKDLRIHDLRRSLGSWQAVTGASLSVIGKTLAHKNVSTTAIYARLNLDPVREAMEKATNAMLAAGKMLSENSQKMEPLEEMLK